MRALIVASLLSALVGVVATPAQEKSTWEPVRGSGFAGVPLTLVPIGDPKKDKLPDGRDTWSGLAEGMSKDADTQKLLKKLLNCQSVEVAVLPKKVDGKFRPAPPTGKSQVYVGIRLSEGEAGENEFKGCVLGSATHMMFEVPETRTWDDKATVWDAFLIAANDYLHRNKKGYHLHHGLLFEPADLDDIDAGIRNPAKRGKYLEKQIKGYLEKYNG